MDAQSMKPETKLSAQDAIYSSEIFAIVQQVSSQISESHMPQVVDEVNGLRTEDKQMLVDLLSVALEKHHHLLINADRVLDLLTEIASSGNIVARNRTLTSSQFTSDIDTGPDVYILPGEPPSRVLVIKRGNKDGPGAFSKALLNWAHLSHPNILPVYGAFLDRKDGPMSFVSPCLNERNIVDHAKTLLQVERMPLISDVIDGICYLHQLAIVHGALNPLSVLISDSGRALVTDLDTSSENCAARYLAPEVLKDEESSPTTAADVWALGCLCYEVLSGNTPFCQYRQERRVALVVTEGKRPTRPGQDGVRGEEINDAVWRPVSACWESRPEDRPSCLKLHGAFASLDICDGRPSPKSMIRSETLRDIEAISACLDDARSLLNRLLRLDQLSAPPSRIPEDLREPLLGLADSLPKANTLAAAVKKLSPDDTQTLVNALDLVLEENSSFINFRNPTTKLLIAFMTSTHVYPQRYKLHRIRYDPSSIAEGSFGKVYKGCDLNICVNMVTNSNDLASIFKFVGIWAHVSHPNVLPFCGVFDEPVNEIPRFCIVSPYLKNGTLYSYAHSRPQRSRIPLIFDVVNGLGCLHKIYMALDNLRPDNVLISDDGRAMISSFSAAHIVTCSTEMKTVRSSTSYMIRFQAPEVVKTGQGNYGGDIWSFGCLCYQVLSRKLPYHQYETKSEVQSALSRGELPARPNAIDSDSDAIGDRSWELIMGCCKFQAGDRLTIPEIQKLLTNLKIEDDRPDAHELPGPPILNLRKRPDIEWDRVKQLLGEIRVELLRNPLSRLIQSRIKDVVAEVVKLPQNEVQTLVDFLDMTLKDHLTISDERNRVLALLSRIMISSQVYPQRHLLKDIKYDPKPIAEGGFGKVHRGRSDPTICVKVTTRINDPSALIAYIRELIFWAHFSHPNVLPFYGVFFDDSQQMCLVSPYMTNGNLRDYTRQLPQKTRMPPLLDTIKGLSFLHGLGVVHTDLKGENVLISNEGRGLITDFGASHIITASAKGGVTSSSVATTLRFTAPEVIQDPTRRMRPTKECDIWSFGCLCYEVLSRKLPFYEYQLDAQVLAALFRGELPKRPGFAEADGDDEYDDLDDTDERDWDDLDDPTWGWITKCLVPKPEDRPAASHIQELIVDMKAWDSRPPLQGSPSAEILKQKLNFEVNLNRAGLLLDHLQILFLARRIYRYSDQEVVVAVKKLDQEDASHLRNFWALVLKTHLPISGERKRLLSLLAAVVAAQGRYPHDYLLITQPRYDPEIIGVGSFGEVYRGSQLGICVRVTKLSGMIPALKNQWRIALVPWAHLSHPNILPFYGASFGANCFFVSPFIENGNLKRYAPRLSQKSRTLLVSDVVEGLIYMHQLGIIHGNLKTQNILISDEGRGLITDFRPYSVNVAAAVDGPTGPFITSTLRFTAPELVRNSQMLPTTASDVWSVGCLVYEVLTQKVPYYKYTQDPQIRSALSRGELPIRPVSADSDTDEIDDQSWDLIMHCCVLEMESRLMLADVQEWLRKMGLEDNRPAAGPLPGAEILKQRFQVTNLDTLLVGEILDKLESHLPKASQEKVKDDEY